jgi:hypothetical protein
MQSADRACIQLLEEHGWSNTAALDYHFEPTDMSGTAENRPEARMERVRAVEARLWWGENMVAKIGRFIRNHSWVTLAMFAFLIFKVIGVLLGLEYLWRILAWTFKQFTARLQLVLTAVFAIVITKSAHVLSMCGDKFSRWACSKCQNAHCVLELRWMRAKWIYRSSSEEDSWRWWQELEAAGVVYGAFSILVLWVRSRDEGNIKD